MIINFSIENFLSIKEKIDFSFESSNKKIPRLKAISIEEGKFNLYTFSAIYGANASGKSNIIKALYQLRSFILYSHSLDKEMDIPSYMPFKLDNMTISAPTKFNIEFIVEEIKYFYVVEFLKDKIVKEELSFYPKGRISSLFKRDKDKIKFGSRFTGGKKQIFETMMLPNRLLLSMIGNSNHKLLDPVFLFFKNFLNIHLRMDSTNYLQHQTTKQLMDDKSKVVSQLLSLLQAADLSVEEIKLLNDNEMLEELATEKDISPKQKKILETIYKDRVHLGHKVFKDGQLTDEIIFFNLEDEESTGTAKMYDLGGKVLNALTNGSVLIIDEFNSGLHPLLCKYIMDLFLNSDINKKNAQLLISTHDTNILDLGVLKREQVWFTEKNQFGATELFSLDEYEDKNPIRNHSKYGKFYLDGRFRAVPNPNTSLVNRILNNE